MPNDIFNPHTHACGNCNTVWFHDPIDVLRLNLDEKFDEAERLNQTSHLCPKCKTEQYYISDADTPPQYLHDGKRCEPITARVPVVDTPEMAEKRKAAKSFLERRRFEDFLDSLVERRRK